MLGSRSVHSSYKFSLMLSMFVQGLGDFFLITKNGVQNCYSHRNLKWRKSEMTLGLSNSLL